MDGGGGGGGGEWLGEDDHDDSVTIYVYKLFMIIEI